MTLWVNWIVLPIQVRLDGSGLELVMHLQSTGIGWPQVDSGMQSAGTGLPSDGMVHLRSTQPLILQQRRLDFLTCRLGRVRREENR